MKIFIKLFLLFISLLGIVSCTPRMMERLWNGYYSQQKAVEEYDKKQDAFYAKETIEQKELRKKNRQICFNISGAYSGNWDQIKYVDCMQERGSPIYRGGN
ncbi:hypothetical protein [Cricetibacter osteomyelitidis]|nr:hypothetical protein [Cricetibacter osteomyelitidis]